MSEACWPLSRSRDARVQIAETEERLLGSGGAGPHPRQHAVARSHAAPPSTSTLRALEHGAAAEPTTGRRRDDLCPSRPSVVPPHVGMAALRQDPGRQRRRLASQSEDMACDSGGHVGGHSPAGTARRTGGPPTPLRVARTARAERRRHGGASGPTPP